MQKFSAKIYKLGINPCVEVPPEISRIFSKRGFVPVIGTLNGHPIRANLVPIGNNRHRLFLNGEMRKNAGVDEGDVVEIGLEIDTEPRVVHLPDEFAFALENDEKLKIAFEMMIPSRRKEILNYLNGVKRPETLKRNIEKVLVMLRKEYARG